MAISRNRPSLSSGDNLQGGPPTRSSWHGDAYVLPVANARQALAEEGSYFVAANAVQGTDITGHVAPALADNDDTPTKALIHIYNGGSKFIMVDYVKLALVVVNASSTATGFVAFVDSEGASGRVSGGTQFTPASARGDDPFSSGATIYAGAVVVASTTANKVGQQVVRPVIAVTLDQYHFWFGHGPLTINTGALTGTAVATVGVSMAPVAIQPGGNFYLCESNPSGASTAATYQIELGYIER